MASRNSLLFSLFLLALTGAWLCRAELLSDSVLSELRDLRFYNDRIRILYELIESQCSQITWKHRGTTDFQMSQLIVVKRHYDKLLKQFQECKKKEGTTTDAVTTQSVSSTVSSDVTPQSVSSTVSSDVTPQPEECLQATNFTESWRLDHAGNEIKPGGPHSALGYACDLHYGIEWFRFTGAAGNKMLDKPPKPLSCGAVLPLWTNASMPVVVGVPKRVPIYVIHPHGKLVRFTYVQVVKCSTLTDSDFVYKNLDLWRGSCSMAFCGMV